MVRPQNANQVTIAALCVVLMCLSLAMVPVVLYPVLRKHSQVLALFALVDSTSSTAVLLFLPMIVQEMVLAVWLIAKGFNSSVVASGAAKTAQNQLLGAA